MNTKNALLGIDPGKAGSLCLYQKTKIQFFSFHNDIIDTIKALNEQYDILKCFIEEQFVIPRQGGYVAFKIGIGYGEYLGCLKTLGIPFETVRPQKWQKEYELSKDRKTRKMQLVDIACDMYPKADIETSNFEKTSGRADSLLIAHYGAMKPL